MRTKLALVGIISLAPVILAGAPPGNAVEVRGVVSGAGEREIRLLEGRIRVQTRDRMIPAGELSAMVVTNISVGQAVALTGAVDADGVAWAFRLRVLHPSNDTTCLAGKMQTTDAGAFSVAGVPVEWDSSTKKKRFGKRVVVEVELHDGRVRAKSIRRDFRRRTLRDVAAWFINGIGSSGTSDTPR